MRPVRDSDAEHIWSATRHPGFNGEMHWDAPESLEEIRPVETARQLWQQRGKRAHLETADNGEHPANEFWKTCESAAAAPLRPCLFEARGFLILFGSGKPYGSRAARHRDGRQEGSERILQWPFRGQNRLDRLLSGERQER